MAAVSTAGMGSADPLASPPSVPSLNNSLGAILLCSCFGCMLFGLTVHQTYRYFRLYPDDSWKLKSFVSAVLFLDIFHTVLCIHICFFYLINNYAIPARLLDGVWSIRLTILVTGCVMIFAHCFYGRRLFLLSGGRVWSVLLIGLLLVTEVGLCIAAAVEAFNSPAFSDYAHYAWLTCTALGVAVFLDVFVAGSLTFYLHTSRTGFKRTDSLIDVLMVYSINTGISTSVITLTAAITAIAMQYDLVYCGLYIVASKMYANSLLALLNSRRSIIDRGMEGFETGSFGLKVVDTADVRAYPFGLAPATKQQTVIDVKVDRETYHDGRLPQVNRNGIESWASASDNGGRPADSTATLGRVHA